MRARAYRFKTGTSTDLVRNGRVIARGTRRMVTNDVNAPAASALRPLHVHGGDDGLPIAVAVCATVPVRRRVVITPHDRGCFEFVTHVDRRRSGQYTLSRV